MKASILNFNDLVEVQLANGENFRASENQDSSELMDQVEAYVTNDLMEEIEFTELTIEKLSAKASKALLTSLKKSTGLLTDMIASILDAREVEYTLPKVVETSEEETESDEVAPVKEDKKKKESKPKAEPKEKKEQLSFEEAMDILKEAKKQAGTIIEFKPFSKDDAPINGLIKTAGIDKRRNRVYYCVEIETPNGKKIVHPSYDNQSIVVNEKLTKEYAEELQKAIEAKDKAKADAKAAKEKEAAEKEAAEKEAAEKEAAEK